MEEPHRPRLPITKVVTEQELVELIENVAKGVSTGEAWNAHLRGQIQQKNLELKQERERAEEERDKAATRYEKVVEQMRVLQEKHSAALWKYIYILTGAVLGLAGTLGGIKLLGIG